MAYVNVADWKPDQVADWLKGLDISIHRYVESFLNNHVNGQHLLNLQPDDLEHHGIFKVGHQEIILEAVDQLRNFHYELDHENLQLLALRVSCLAHSLHRDLQNSSPMVSTQTLSDIATIIKAVKPLVCWLDRPPFSGQLAYIDKKAELLRLSLEIATSGQRDRFADRPIEIFRMCSKRLAELADEMIREIHDPLLLQPASLDLATLKKRPGDHLGFCIIPSFHGNHQIGEIKCNSTAYQSGKIECGDEIVQINYQTVVGWDVKQVMALFEESSSDIFLTLKKRPCHSKILGQIYMKPYRLPSKKQVSYASRWFLGDNISPPRINIGGGHFDIKPLNNHLSNSINRDTKEVNESVVDSKEDVHIDHTSSNTINEKEEEDDEDEDEDIEHEEEEESISSPTSVRLYLPKPRLPVQRRATITGTGASPTSKRAPLNLEQLWHELKLEREWRLSGKQRKSEKSTSEILLSATSPSDSTSGEHKVSLKATKAASADCLKSVQSDFTHEKKLNLNSMPVTKFISENETIPAKEKENIEKQADSQASNVPYDSEVNFIPLKERIQILNKNIDNQVIATCAKPKIPPRKLVSNEGFSSLTNSPVHRLLEKKPIARPRGKLDKSQSTPVYDLNDRSDSNTLEVLFKDRPQSKRLASEQTQKRPVEETKSDTNNSTVHVNIISKLDSLSCSKIMSTHISESTNKNDLSPYVRSISDNITIPIDHSPPKTPLKIITKDSAICSSPARKSINSEGLFVSKIQLTSGELHISESDDSVFIADDEEAEKIKVKSDDVHKHTEARIDELKYLISPQRKQSIKHPAITNIILNDNSMIQKMKFIDDPESPTFVLQSKTVPPDLKPRDSNLPWEPEKVSPKRSIDIPKSQPASQSHLILNSEDDVGRNPTQTILSARTSYESTPTSPSTSELPSKPEAQMVLSHSKANQLEDNKIHFSLSHNSTRDDFSFLKIDPIRKLPRINNSSSSLSTSSSAEAVNKLNFACSTPVKNSSTDTTEFQQPSTYPRKKPEIKSLQAGPSTSISHNSSLRAMIPFNSKNKTTSPKVFRKKNNILKGKRRNISVKDLVLPDCEGWLFQRDRKVSTVPQWIRGWFIIKGNNFYGFIDKDSKKAHLFIYLPGFTVSPAVEVKSRKYSLKIYHTGTTFYLSADSQDEYSTWLNCLSQATIAHDRSPVENITFSESEGEEKSDSKSDSDKKKDCFSSPKVKKMSHFFSGPLSTSKHDKKFSSLKKSKKPDSSNLDNGNSSLDRKYLRFLSGGNNVPVPTAHFRSYRRVPPSHLSDPNTSGHDTSFTSSDSLTHRTSPPLQLPPDMADYRLASMARAGHTPSRQREQNTSLEAFMISRQGEERRQNVPDVPLIRPPQHSAPSAPEDSICRSESVRPSISIAGTSQKDNYRLNLTENCAWSDTCRPSSSRNCNTIPDIQTKRLKKMAGSNTQSGACGEVNSLSELDDTTGKSRFQRNVCKSSSSSKLRSFFSTAHWQDSTSKGLLGSPRLKRVLFRDKSDANNRNIARSYSANSATIEQTNTANDSEETPDYPGLEYPPVFVPESYSLSYVTSILEARSNASSNTENGPKKNETNQNQSP